VAQRWLDEWLRAWRCKSRAAVKFFWCHPIEFSKGSLLAPKHPPSSRLPPIVMLATLNPKSWTLKPKPCSPPSQQESLDGETRFSSTNYYYPKSCCSASNPKTNHTRWIVMVPPCEQPLRTHNHALVKPFFSIFIFFYFLFFANPQPRASETTTMSQQSRQSRCTHRDCRPCCDFIYLFIEITTVFF